MIVFITFIWALCAVVLITTALPLSTSVRWWVRMWDFPRYHIAGLAFALAPIAWIALPVGGIVAALIMIACGVYHLYRIFPYTLFATPEVDLSPDIPDSRQVTFLAANVLMENTRYADFARIIEREDPDVLFLMETNQTWLDALQPSLDRFTTVLSDPRDTHYGLIFATKLNVISAEITFLSDDDTPSVHAELCSPDGEDFNFIGMHPRPPVPGNDTDDRDKEILRAAKATKKADRQTVCMGDFNDVAWSHTSERFKRKGKYLEPRVGRGLVASFHANHKFLRLPIDQLYMTRRIELVSFGRLESAGSDHFPIKAVLAFPKSKQG